MDCITENKPIYRCFDELGRPLNNATGVLRECDEFAREYVDEHNCKVIIRKTYVADVVHRVVSPFRAIVRTDSEVYKFSSFTEYRELVSRLSIAGVSFNSKVYGDII